MGIEVSFAALIHAAIHETHSAMPRVSETIGVKSSASVEQQPSDAGSLPAEIAAKEYSSGRLKASRPAADKPAGRYL